MGRFEGKRILITGGTRGMGHAAAKSIIAEGGEAWVTGVDPQRLEAAAATLGANGRALRNDAAATDTGQALANWVAGAGLLDGLWLNAGYAELGPLEQVDAQAFDRMLATNVRGPALQLAALSPLLKPGASVLVSASSSAYEAAAMASLYAASKGALVSMARCWASALSARRIRVNVLLPGPIATGFRDFLGPQAQQDFDRHITRQVPLGRLGSADEAAAVALFLLSDAASFVTGSQYPVDGGLMMR